LPELDRIFGALSDPTRRHLLETLMSRGASSVPELLGDLSISRQAVAKHVSVLNDAGLIERSEVSGREVFYRLAPSALLPVVEWVSDADAAWSGRLDRLKRAAESRS
jgi:DNA-binding transcriptional ArsR family regulator